MNSHDVWGPINMGNWLNTPCIFGRMANEDDVVNGDAVFYLQDNGQNSAKPYTDIKLPACGLLNEDDKTTPVIVIQIESTADQIIVGFRNIDGGNGACTFPEITFLDSPNERFH